MSSVSYSIVVVVYLFVFELSVVRRLIETLIR